MENQSKFLVAGCQPILEDVTSAAWVKCSREWPIEESRKRKWAATVN